MPRNSQVLGYLALLLCIKDPTKVTTIHYKMLKYLKKQVKSV